MKKCIFPEELTKLRDQFLDYLNKLGRGQGRLYHIRYSINNLYQFMGENGLKDIPNLTQKHLIQFQYCLYKEKQYSGHAVIYYLQDLDLFSRYLLHNNIIWKNPFSDIRHISPPELSKREIKRYYNFNELITRWQNWMKRKEYHTESVTNRINSLNIFIPFLKERGIKTVYKIKPDTIDEFKQYLTTYQYRRSAESVVADKQGQCYSPFTQVIHLRNICSFLLFLDREKIIYTDPSKHVMLKRYYKELDLKYRTEALIKPKKKEPYIPNPEIQKLLDKFLQYTLSKGGSQNTLRSYIISIQKFYEFIKSRGIEDLRRVARRDIMDLQSWLATVKNTKAVKYSSNTVLGMLICLRSFFRYLVKYEYLVCDHTANIDLPKHEDGIPHTCMTEREVGLFLNQPNTLDPIGLRDKAIMEVLYSTGIRANELVNLKIHDIDSNTGLCRVDHPKGGKSYQRIIPIGKLACNWVKEYIGKVRPLLGPGGAGPDGISASYGTSKTNNKGHLFLSNFGRQLRSTVVNSIIKKYLFHSGLRKNITTHSFRVTCATHMLQNNADIRYVQQQLGHRSIRTTQGYTRLVPKDLKEVHSRTHPREKLLTK